MGIPVMMMVCCALPDAFLDAGALPTLYDRYGISCEALSQRIKDWLK